ncbi:hypothetical protein CDAR_167311 [Caerostris darwini]|uniref:Uncharacterized protein n=1 Tax=Caerostris darwini TaxID=1538125 RepID=A0AAV4TKD4_9ARAC|nr:hypothetical protein CDAR_167311 [Caerostris darwini]
MSYLPSLFYPPFAKTIFCEVKRRRHWLSDLFERIEGECQPALPEMQFPKQSKSAEYLKRNRERKNNNNKKTTAKRSKSTLKIFPCHLVRGRLRRYINSEPRFQFCSK